MEKLVLSNNMLNTIKQNLLESITIASAAKSSATYYHKGDEQVKAMKSQVEKLYNLSKELPLIVASQKGVTGKFASEVLLNEFKRTQKGGACNIVNPIEWYDEGLGEKAVLSVLYNIGESGIPYILRMFVDLKKNKINNERTRKIVLGYLWGQDNLEFYCVKYRNKISEVLKHVYGVRRTSILLNIAKKQLSFNGTLVLSIKESAILNELILKYYNGDADKALKLLLFIFKKDENLDFDAEMFPVLSEYQKAKTNIVGIKVIPEEILIGLVSDKKHPQYHSMWATKAMRETTKATIRETTEATSVNQQVRQTKSTAKLGVQKTVNLEKATDYLALYKTGYENGFTDEIKNAINKLASKNKIEGFYYSNIGVIVDDSSSMKGHKQESKNTPKAIADFTSRVLKLSANNAKVIKTTGEITDLAGAFVELLKNSVEYDAIFILTDGYENAYDGLINEVISVYQAEFGNNAPIFQISPITSAEMGANVRKLGSNVVTMAINNPIALQPQINARLLEIDTKRWLENQVNAIAALPLARTKKITVNQ